MKIGVLGSGAWGISVASLLAGNDKNEVVMWEFDKKTYEQLVRERRIENKLPGFYIPDCILIVNNIREAIDGCKVVINAVPTQFIRSYFDLIQDVDFSEKIVVNVSKGIEVKTGKDIREMFIDEFETINDDNFVILAGPSFANQVSISPTPTAVVAACKKLETANFVRDLVSTEMFRVYSNEDVVGVEIGGSVKNIMAIAAGVIDGLGFGDNTKAALLTRGLAEMMRFGLKQGAKRDTFTGLSGLGDLILTCNSSLSRNWQVGNRIGKGEKLKSILASMSMVAEGVETTKSVYKIAKDKNVEMPITFAIYKVLFEEIDPREIIADLMLREKKVED